MITAAIVLTLTQAAAAEAQTIPTCSMVTPRGDAIGFFVWTGDNPSEVNFTATQNSVWPQHTLTGSTRTLGPTLWFAIGDRSGFILTMGPPAPGSVQRPAMLFPKDGREGLVPRAYGFCEERPVPADAEAPRAENEASGSAIPAFDPALWPDDDCALILSDGRRIRFRFRLTERDQVQMQSAELWSGRPVIVPNRWENSPGIQIGNFGGGDGPEGSQMLTTNGSRAAKVVHIRRLGDASMPDMSGYGICGYRAIVRRARR